MAIRCHSAFKHYEMYHGNSACCGGGDFTINNKIVYNVGCDGKHGNTFWSGLGLGIGAALGNMFNCRLGGFGMGNTFGTFGMGNLFGGYGLYGGGGSKPSKSSSEHTCHCSCTSKKDGDKDSPVMERLTKAISELKKQKQEGKELDADKVNKLKEELNKLKDNPIDAAFEFSNKYTYNKLLEDLNKLTEETQQQEQAPVVEAQEAEPIVQAQPEPEVAAPAAQTIHEPNKDAWVTEFNPSITTIPSGVPSVIQGYENVTSDNVGALTDNTLKRAKDLSKKTLDVVSNNGAKVSEAKYSNTDFPLYLQISDSKEYNYKCIGTDGSGRAYYATPESDTNKNVYILVKKGDDFVLLQVNNKFSGYGKGDKQS